MLFYFRNGANFASVYTQSTITSENIKWNKLINSKKIKALLINTKTQTHLLVKVDSGTEGNRRRTFKSTFNKKKNDDEEFEKLDQRISYLGDRHYW